MASTNDFQSMQIESYYDLGNSYSITATLSGTPGTVTSIAVPSEAKGVKIYPRGNSVYFTTQSGALAATATSSATTIAVAALSAGSIAKAEQWETRLFKGQSKADRSDGSRTLQIASATASVVVDVEFF